MRLLPVGVDVALLRHAYRPSARLRQLRHLLLYAHETDEQRVLVRSVSCWVDDVTQYSHVVTAAESMT